MDPRVIRLMGVVLDLCILVGAAAFISIRINAHSYYSGDVRSGQSAAYIANFYRARGYSLSGSILGVHVNGTVIESPGFILDSARASLFFSTGRDVLIVYSSDQKIRDPLPQEVDPLRLSLKVDREVDRALISLDPIWTTSLTQVIQKVSEISQAIEEAGAQHEVYVTLKLHGKGLSEAISSNEVPIYWLEDLVNSECSGLFLFVGSTVAPFYLLIENMNWRDLGKLNALLERWIPSDSLNMLAYDIQVKVVFAAPPDESAKALIYKGLMSIPGVRYVKFTTEFKD